MRFALLGNHPDGLALARALADSGRHEIVAFTAAIPFDLSRPNQATRLPGTAIAIAGSHTTRPPSSAATLADDARSQRPTDLEEILADPSIESIIVAGPLADRSALLRRALQSERHVLCVHPVDQTPETAYEAGMIRQDVRRLLVPLLLEGLHPAVRRLERVHRERGSTPPAATGIGSFRLLERWSATATARGAGA